MSGDAIYGFEDCSELALMLSEVMGVDYIEGKEDHTLVVSGTPGKRGQGIHFRDDYFDYRGMGYNLYIILMLIGTLLSLSFAE